VSVHDCVRRLRLADVVRLLADGDHNVRSALYTSGWRSPKSLYAAAVAVTGLPFDRLFALPRDEWERRLAFPRLRTNIDAAGVMPTAGRRARRNQARLSTAVA
jgi:hypothetical protein